MALDSTTETIAHFIGLFHLTLEETRLREEYLKYRSDRATAEEIEALSATPFSVSAQYRLKAYHPELAYKPTNDQMVWDAHQSQSEHFNLPSQTLNSPFHDKELIGSSLIEFSGPTSFSFELAVPASVIAVTIQFNVMTDNDTIGAVTTGMKAGAAAFDAVLNELVRIAENLSVLQLPELPVHTDGWQAYATQGMAALGTAAKATLPPAFGPAVSWVVLTGAAADGLFINGVSEDEIPDLESVLPVFLRPPSVQEDASTHDFDADFQGNGGAEAWRVQDGHQVVAGGNTQLNEMQLVSSWLDAGVFAVNGDVTHIDAISQVNVMATADLIGKTLASSASHALNIAEITTTSSAPQPEETVDQTLAMPGPEPHQDGSSSGGPTELIGLAAGGPIVESEDTTPQVPSLNVAKEPSGTSEPEVRDGSPVYTGLPNNSAVVRVEADVLQINYTNQVNFGIDNDMGTVTISAAATFVGLGDNQMYNIADFYEIGYGYDLIMVGGDMIDITMLQQTNVLLDYNSVLGTAGDVRAEVGDNLQYNLAVIEKVGVDTEVEMAREFEEGLKKLSEGAEEISSEVASNALFEGVEFLRVLYIDGDFVTVTLTEQTNILGDVDQLRVAHAAQAAAAEVQANIGSALEAKLEVMTGSNAQANVAKVQEYGLDSTVMASGTQYSDALIHQASLIDMDAVSAGVDIAALTNEAVAFLADGLIGPETQPAEITRPEMFMDTAGHVDVMETALA